jgi:hypothetical protein
VAGDASAAWPVPRGVLQRPVANPALHARYARWRAALEAAISGP